MVDRVVSRVHLLPKSRRSLMTQTVYIETSILGYLTERLALLQVLTFLELTPEATALALEFLRQSNLPAKAANDALQYREEYARFFNYDLTAICQDLRNKQVASGRTFVRLPIKRLANAVSVSNKTEGNGEGGNQDS